jgi:putative ABC transport system substrate-binding protein
VNACRRSVLAGLAAAGIGMPLRGLTQSPGVARIGYLATSPPAATPKLLDAFRETMRAQGYIEGTNLTVEYRWPDAALQPHPELARDLVRKKVDVIVAWGTPAALAAQQATSSIPIVMVSVGDPVGTGLVSNLARPGANITGVSNLGRDLNAKLVELLTLAMADLRRIAAIRNALNPLGALHWREVEAAARAKDLYAQVVDLRTADDLEPAFAAISAARLQGVVALADPLFLNHRKRVADLGIRHRVATVFQRNENVEAGGLMSYGSTLADEFRLAATYAARILKGAKAGDLPVEMASRFELAINMKTANVIGLRIPPSLLARADRVIE